MVQHDWDGQHHQFQITPVRSADGKLTKDHMNSMESQRYYNNIKDKTIHLEEKNGGILLNIKTLVAYCYYTHYYCYFINGYIC